MASLHLCRAASWVALVTLFLTGCPSHHELAYPRCKGDEDCHAGEHCFDQQCSQCATAADCPAGESCERGVCTKPACVRDDDCPAGSSCLDGVCKPCGADGDCGPGGRCNAGRCQRAKACKTDDDCPPAQDCVNGLCIGDRRAASPPPGACQLSPIYFDFDSAVVAADQTPTVQADGQCLATQTAGALLEGHTDPAGTEEYNLGLSDRRARAVRDLLSTLGIAGTRLRVLPMGEAGSSANDDDAARKNDRRVDVRWE